MASQESASNNEARVHNPRIVQAARDLAAFIKPNIPVSVNVSDDGFINFRLQIPIEEVMMGRAEFARELANLRDGDNDGGSGAGAGSGGSGSGGQNPGQPGNAPGSGDQSGNGGSQSSGSGSGGETRDGGRTRRRAFDPPTETENRKASDASNVTLAAPPDAKRPRPNRYYSQEAKARAVALLDAGTPVRKVAKLVSPHCGSGTPTRWRQQARKLAPIRQGLEKAATSTFVQSASDADCHSPMEDVFV